MAQITQPIIGPYPRGQIAKTLIFQKRRHKVIVKAYAIPREPKTPAQLYQRYLLGTATHQMKRITRDQELNRAWQVYVNEFYRTHTWFNAHVRAIMQTHKTDIRHKSWPSSYHRTADRLVFTMLDLATEEPAVESGDFTLYYGPTVKTMHNTRSGQIEAGGRLWFRNLPKPPQHLYCYIQKRTRRTGIIACLHPH